MRQLNLNEKEVLLVPIPKGAKKFILPPNYPGILWFELPPMRGMLTAEIPLGSWTILGKGDEVTDPEIIEALEGMDKDTTLILTSKK